MNFKASMLAIVVAAGTFKCLGGCFAEGCSTVRIMLTDVLLSYQLQRIPRSGWR